MQDACARWSRLRFAVDATAYPRPDAWCSPGREHVHNGACRCRGSSKTAPGWEYQFTAAIGHLRTAWAALLDVARTTPATRTAADDRAGEERAAPPARRRARAKAAPLFVFDAGYSAAALTDGLLGCPVHLLVRLAAGSVFYADPFTWEGRYGRPARHGAAVHCLEPEDFRADAGTGPRGRKKPLPPNPEPDEALVLPDTPLYGTVRAEAWHGVHPLIHGDRGWFAGSKHLPVLRGTLVHVTVERLPDGRDPHRAMWLWHAGPGPLSLDELWRAYLARFDIEHAFKLLKGALGLTTAKVRAPGRPTAGPGSSWPPAPSSCSPGPWQPTSAGPGRNTPIPPGRCHLAGSAGGFATSAATWGHPPMSRNPPDPGPAGPKAAAKAQHPATFSPAKPICRAPQK